jgi:hypothetical protein
MKVGMEPKLAWKQHDTMANFHLVAMTVEMEPKLATGPSGFCRVVRGWRRADLLSTWQQGAGAATPLSLLLGLAFIVFPVMMLVLSVPTWEQRSVDAEDAARAAARALATADSTQGAVALANQAVAAVMQADGLSAGEFEANYRGELIPGATVTATVSVQVPVGEVPGLGALGDLRYTASSTAHVDSFEDSLTGGALGP